MRRTFGVVAATVALVFTACGGGGGDAASGRFAPAEGGEERTVLVDYRHDEFTSAFLRYYPEKVTVRPGDVVNFRQTWTGEPHSVTMGKVVDDLFQYGELFEKYESEEEAKAGGVPQETIDLVNETFTKLPAMVGDGYDTFAPGAEPCYVATYEAIPAFSLPGDDGGHVPGVQCPARGDAQPRFTGRDGLYNSGFIPPDGERANVFELPIAEDAEPGTYRYFCNYHWVGMSGEVEIVAAGADIPSQQEVSRQGRREIEADAKVARQRVEEARKAKGKVGDLPLPLAGREADEDFAVIINEFLPRKVATKVGEPVTWTFDGIDHTVSFNVPKYFPIFTVKESGEVFWEPESYEPVGWSVPERADRADGEEEPPPRNVDVGEWDGKSGFHSSGALSPGDTFTVTFTKAGTYPFACVLHPQMVGTVEVE